jgi:hypothetical protein
VGLAETGRAAPRVLWNYGLRDHECRSEIEANLAKGALQAAGIDAVIQADAAGRQRDHIAWSGTGFGLLVREEDSPDASIAGPARLVRSIPGGNMYARSSLAPAFEVWGSILAEYGRLGWERSFLGYLLTGEQDSERWCPSGRFNQFEHGFIDWCPGKNARAHRGDDIALRAELNLPCK